MIPICGRIHSGMDVRKLRGVVHSFQMHTLLPYTSRFGDPQVASRVEEHQPSGDFRHKNHTVTMPYFLNACKKKCVFRASSIRAFSLEAKKESEQSPKNEELQELSPTARSGIS